MEPNYTPTPPTYQRKRRSDKYLEQDASALAAASAPAEAAPAAQRQPLRAVVTEDEAAARAAYREPIRVARPSSVQINAQPELGRREHQQRPAADQRKPIIVAGAEQPVRVPQPQRTAHPGTYAHQPTASQLPQAQPVQSVQPPMRRTVQPQQARQSAGYVPAADPTGIVRSASHDHMLQSGQPGSMALPVQAPVPRWILGAIMLVILLGLGCFTGRMLMDSYLYQQETAREEAFQKVVDAHPIQYLDLIQRYSMEYNLQPAFVASIILNESSYNTHAESSVGARGLMQLMPDTAQWIAHKLGLDSSYNAEQLWTAETNIRFGCWYLNYLSKQFSGDAVTVASAYHTGQGEVSGWLNNRTYAPDGRALSLTGMPDGPTKVYAGRVTRDYAIYDALYFKTFND